MAIWYLAFSLPGGLTIAATCPLVDSRNRGRPPTAAPARDGGERLRTLTAGGRVLRVAVRDGDPGWPPLLLCNGIGVSLELFQPFVDALDPQRPIIRFDMPGIGGSPSPVLPYHLLSLPSLLAGLLDQLG